MRTEVIDKNYETFNLFYFLRNIIKTGIQLIKLPKQRELILSLNKIIGSSSLVLFPIITNNFSEAMFESL